MVLLDGGPFLMGSEDADCIPADGEGPVRKVRVDPTSILVSGRSARVASRGIEREGLPAELIAEITAEYRRAKPGKSVPDSEFRKRRTSPLLLVHAIQATTDGGKTAPDHLVALGLSFPVFDDSDVARRVTYRVNLIEWNALLESEVDEQLEEGDEDAD